MQILSPTMCLKRQILFSWENKKNITNLSTAELAKRVVKVKPLSGLTQQGRLSYFSQKIGFDFSCRLSKETIGLKCLSLFS